MGWSCLLTDGFSCNIPRTPGAADRRWMGRNRAGSGSLTTVGKEPRLASVFNLWQGIRERSVLSSGVGRGSAVY